MVLNKRASKEKMKDKLVYRSPPGTIWDLTHMRCLETPVETQKRATPGDTDRPNAGKRV